MVKKAVLLSFRLNDMEMISGGPGDNQRGASAWWDKVPSNSRAGQMSNSEVQGFELCQIVSYAVPRT